MSETKEKKRCHRQKKKKEVPETKEKNRGARDKRKKEVPDTKEKKRSQTQKKKYIICIPNISQIFSLCSHLLQSYQIENT